MLQKFNLFNGEIFSSVVIHLFSISFRMIHQSCELMCCISAVFRSGLVLIGRLLAKHGLEVKVGHGLHGLGV